MLTFKFFILGEWEEATSFRLSNKHAHTCIEKKAHIIDCLFKARTKAKHNYFPLFFNAKKLLTRRFPELLVWSGEILDLSGGVAGGGS